MSRRVVHVFTSLFLLGQAWLSVFAASEPQLNFKIYSPSPDSQETGATSGKVSPQTPEQTSPDSTETATSPALDSPASNSNNSPEANNTQAASPESPSPDTPKLQGYIRVVPSGTKIPIIMDSAVDSDTSQEGDEFAARTGEDLNIDGSTIVPAGSIIKGRIAQLNAPRHFSRSGSVALKFDTVTTPDNRQIPLVANLVARGGVVHARRGLKDIALDTGSFAVPTALGVGIGAIAGGAHNGSSKIGTGGGALIGAGIGAAVGVIILCAKKGKRVDVRPGDELKIELAEDLRMPM